MKTGLTLEQLAAEITRQQSAKEDYVVNTGNLRLESYGPELTLRVLDSGGADRIEPLEIGDIAHRQIGTHLSIPAKYYERMRSEDPGLLAHNVNTWLERTPAQRMIRVLDGKARAYLSNRYLRMDNYSIASAVLPILAEIPDVRIESCQITDSRMYIKAVNPRLQEDVTPGDTVQAGVVISNSEVGLGSVNIQPLIYRLVCSNGMVVNDAATKRNHIGRATDAEENFQLYSEKTLAADDHAFLLKVQDTVRAAAEEARFAQVVGMMREAAAVPMNTADVPGVVKLASRQFGLTDSEGEGILQHLIEGHDLSLYGLSNHNLVYAFLNEKKLPEDEYYDVVVFGYLQAVMDYTTQGESSRFSFATIAWRKMESRLADHFRHQASTKRAAPTVSLNAVMDDAGLSLSDMLSATDESFLEMETGLLFHDLGRHMPRRDMNVLRLKADGYGTREIAQRENTTVHMVRSILKCAY